jgi:hypothetical protein
MQSKDDMALLREYATQNAGGGDSEIACMSSKAVLKRPQSKR